MSNVEAEPRRERTLIYWVSLGLLVVLVLIGLLTFSSAKSTRQAQDKADQLIASLHNAGARTPSQDQVVRVLGDDGGAVCEDPGSALRKAIFYGQLTNGASGPGNRAVIADNRAVQGQALVMKVYCPDKLPDYQDWADNLDVDHLVKGS